MMDNERINRYAAQAIAAWEVANGKVADRAQAQEIAAIAVMLAVRDVGAAAANQELASASSVASSGNPGFSDLGATLLDMAFKSKFRGRTNGVASPGGGAGEPLLAAEIRRIVEGVFGRQGGAGQSQQSAGGDQAGGGQQKADAAKDALNDLSDNIARMVRDILGQMENGGSLHDMVGEAMQQASATVGEMADLLGKADQWVKRQAGKGPGTP